MNKNRISFCEGGLKKVFFMMRLSFYLVLLGCLHVSAAIDAQTRVALNVKNVTLHDVIWELQKQTGFVFLYSTQDIESVRLSEVSAAVKSVKEVLDDCLKNTGLTYNIQDDVIVIRKAEALPALPQQTIAVRGIVRDDSGETLPGVSVRIKGTSTGTATDVQGRFEIKVPSLKNTILVFSFVGMIPQEVSASDKEMQIVMQREDTQLDEVVVTGYSTVSREAYTGSATVVGADKIAERPVASFQDVLRGNSPGTLVTSTGQPGVGATIRLRGISSMNASNAPLYVVDGVVWDAANMSGDAEYPTNPLNTLNPSDIASMTILKDAASSSLYGSRGANGVIVITTKQGKQGQKVNYTVDVQFGVSRIFKASKPDLVNREEFIDLWLEGEMHYQIQRKAGKKFFDEVKKIYADKEGYKFSGKNYNEWMNLAKSEFNKQFKIYNPVKDDYYNAFFDKDGAKGEDYSRLPDVDWYDEVTRVAPFQKINASARGGNDVVKFYTSLEYFNQQGILRSSELKRYSFRANLSSDNANRFLNWGISNMMSYSDQSGPRRDALGYAMPQYTALSLAPIVPVKLEDGSYNFKFPSNVNSNMNPVAIGKYYTYARPQLKALLSGWLKFNFTKWLNFKSVAAVDYLHTRKRHYYDKDFGDGKKDNGYLSERDARRTMITNSNLLYFNKTFGGVHDVSAYGGIELETMTSAYIAASGKNFLSDDYPYLSASSVPGGVSGSGDEYAMFSWLMKLDYAYDNKYYIGGSFRSDRSSRFHPDHRVGNFWSVSGAWRISQEKFLQDNPVINNLKLKVSYGINGTLPSSYYSWRSRYGFGYDYAGDLGIAPVSISNKKLTWEENKVFNVGLDIRMWDRLNIGLEYYSRKSSNLLLDEPISMVTGHEDRLVNSSAGLKNQGIELEMSVDIIRDRRVNWEFSMNLATLKNKFFGLKSDDIGTQIKRNGESYYSWYLREWAGTDPETGEQRWYYTDTDGKKAITKNYDEAERKIVGCALPKVNGGFSTVISFEGLELSCLFTYGLGHKVLDYTGRVATKNDGKRDYRTMERDQLDRWTPDNPGGKNPLRINTKWDRWLSTRYLYKGDYLKFKNLKLQYTFPTHVVSKIRLGGVKIFAQAENLIAFTALKGYDPEMTLNGYRNPDDYPSATTYTAGLQINF